VLLCCADINAASIAYTDVFWVPVMEESTDDKLALMSPTVGTVAPQEESVPVVQWLGRSTGNAWVAEGVRHNPRNIWVMQAIGQDRRPYGLPVVVGAQLELRQQGDTSSTVTSTKVVSALPTSLNWSAVFKWNGPVTDDNKVELMNNLGIKVQFRCLG
jgi:hypothetical protein